MTDRTDEELVAAYRAGEEMAATELVRRHAAPLGRFFYAGGMAPAEVDDLLQEAFFRAFRAVASWRGDASFRNWVLRIARNVRNDEFRRRKGRIDVPLDDQDVRDGADPAGEVEAGELESRLRAAIGRLPRLQREVFLLRSQQGMDYEAISGELGTTPGAARVHFHHAVKRLKELVE
jgi:RNA polymerase sigma-70 factor (ECF subfamily)